ncbi:MAG: hypothetical protein IPQ17_07570 [Xanthomonadales bacterium]|jgi:hypothetical protein|uniref:hypothetical protein n=1 Tax=Dokdonella sp. TaxID=2291710 RepID=UPI0031C17C61|nr:hypothetical protein [Xanthomonadales bacterium]
MIQQAACRTAGVAVIVESRGAFAGRSSGTIESGKAARAMWEIAMIARVSTCAGDSFAAMYIR